MRGLLLRLVAFTALLFTNRFPNMRATFAPNLEHAFHDAAGYLCSCSH